MPATRYEIVFTESAIELLGQITDVRHRGQIRSCIESLQGDPLARAKPLKGELQGLYSVRAAGQRYRIIYQVDEANARVVVWGAGIRKEGDRRHIYSTITRLFRRHR